MEKAIFLPDVSLQARYRDGLPVSSLKEGLYGNNAGFEKFALLKHNKNFVSKSSPANENLGTFHPAESLIFSISLSSVECLIVRN